MEEMVETVAVVEVWAEPVAMEAVAVDLAVAEDANAGYAHEASASVVILILQDCDGAPD